MSLYSGAQFSHRQGAALRPLHLSFIDSAGTWGSLPAIDRSRDRSSCSQPPTRQQTAAMVLPLAAKFKLLAGPTLCYASQVAQRLAAEQRRPAIAIATELAAEWQTHLHQPRVWPPPLATVLPHLHIHVAASGAIHLVLSDRAIAAWLDRWQLAAVPAPAAAPMEVPFRLHHAHARCCSLLRLAQQTGRVALQPADPTQWQLEQPVPWLTATATLRLDRPVDQALMRAIWTTRVALQERDRLPPVLALQQATGLSSAFEAFHRERPLFGAQPIEVTWCQCGFLFMTQRLLYHLLSGSLHQAIVFEL